MPKYIAYGLIIDSELELPEFLPYDDPDSNSDVVIQLTDVPERLDHPEVVRKGDIELCPNQYLFHHEVASYYITNANSIQIDVKTDIFDSAVRTYLYSTVFTALLYQHGFFIFHASVVQRDGRAYAFVGRSGRGKSTIAAGLIDLGFKLVADDICAIKLKNDIPVVYPAFPSVKLWNTSLETIGWNHHNKRLEKSRSDGIHSEKYWIDLEDFSSRAYALNGAYYLSFNSNQSGFSIDEIASGLNKMDYLLHGSFRFGMVEGLQIQDKHFNLCTNLAKHLKMYRLGRHESSNNVREFVTYILDKLH